MKLYRYCMISVDRVDAVNQLLVRGWRPVRETPITGSAQVLVLFERDGDFASYSGTTIDGTVPMEFLAEVPILQGLSPDELKQVVNLCEVKSYSAGENVFVAGQLDPALYVILSGEIRITMEGLHLEGTDIISLKAKDVFGESTFFSPAAHSATAECLTDVRVLRLPRDRYDELAQAPGPKAMRIAINAAEILGTRLQETDLWLQELLKDEQAHRIAESWGRFRRRLSDGGAEMPGGVFTV